MFLYVLADDILENLGQISAIILAFYMFVFIVIVLAVSVGLMVGFTWVRQKSELVKTLRPVIDSDDETTKAAIHKELPSPGPD